MKRDKFILSEQTQAIFETVINGKQVVEVIETGESIFVDSSLKQFFTNNEIYFATNLTIAKRLAKDILGSVHAAPYLFMDLVFVPLVTPNRSDTLYIALHHFEKICSTSSSKEAVLQLTGGVRIRLQMSKTAAQNRIGIACIVKILMDLRNKSIDRSKNFPPIQLEIIKEPGNVYFTRKGEHEEGML